MRELLKDKKHIHMIGIGGSGMFPLAQILHQKGCFLTGSDNNETDTLQLVREMGIQVFMGHHPKNVEGADLIVHSAAIMQDNPELVRARALGIEAIDRSVLLGYVTEHFANAYCVAGTHGKTTVSALLTQIFLTADKDPAAVIGGKLPLIGGNGRAGSGSLMVCEACEYVDTFLKLSPGTAVILNIDADHLEYFKTMDRLIESFHKFADAASHAVVYNGDDANTRTAIKGLTQPLISFGFDDQNDYTVKNERIADGRSHFDIYKKGEKLCSLSLHIPGRHNILNALAATVCADLEGVSPEKIEEAAAAFTGAGRRFERLGTYGGFTVIDDYAHHPAELEATLKASLTLGYRRVWAVFQPFTYSRTAMLLDDFAKVLSLADCVVLSPIMGSREVNTYGICSEDLAQKVDGAIVLESFDQIADYIRTHAKAGDLVLTLGCGDIYKAAKLMLRP